MSIVFQFLPGALIGCVIVNYYYMRRVLMHWRLSLRREAVMAAMFRRLVSDFHEQTSRAEVGEILTVGSVRLADELNNQARHERDFWLRVPQVGSEWPDFEPAVVTFIEEEDGD